MTREKIAVAHLGRKSTLSVAASRRQIDAFLQLLEQDQFFIESKRQSENGETWTLGRKIRLMAGDWPMRVIVEQNGQEVTISYFIFTPWIWIITLAIMLFFFLPFFSIRGTPLVFLIGLGVITLAIYKQRLDCSPDASWQGPPRQRWNEKMIRFVTEALGGEE
ncbi:MAG: hypothetical protein KJO08_05795 [Gammaproteobacteria bacterium]|nr:hypothetical protein [Gammaproteobacteria bacterium]NNJ84833.1 hypothetical protein [Gammaproteobacteria bacterium]